jgi:hypothetical protein
MFGSTNKLKKETKKIAHSKKGFTFVKKKNENVIYKRFTSSPSFNASSEVIGIDLK